MGEPYLWRTANMSRRTCVVVKQMQSNPIHLLSKKIWSCIDIKSLTTYAVMYHQAHIPHEIVILMK